MVCNTQVDIGVPFGVQIWELSFFTVGIGVPFVLVFPFGFGQSEYIIIVLHGRLQGVNIGVGVCYAPQKLLLVCRLGRVKTLKLSCITWCKVLAVVVVAVVAVVAV